MKKLLKACLSIFLSFLMCFMAVPVMAAEQAEEVYGETLYLSHMPTHYRQSDARWKDIIMGGSTNLSIGNYGCALTSFAMVASFYGSSDTPIEVNTKMTQYAANFQFEIAASRYGYPFSTKYYNDNPTASLYAVTNYVRSAIFNDSPVIIGLCKPNGDTHFVVAYGYIDMEPGGTPYIPILDPSTLYNYSSVNQYYNNGWAVHRVYVY